MTCPKSHSYDSEGQAKSESHLTLSVGLFARTLPLPGMQDRSLIINNHKHLSEKGKFPVQ